MNKVMLYRPELDEMSFRQNLLSDPETMAYNHAYGGTIDFPVDNIAADNPSIKLFLSAGFRERFRNEEYILVEKELTL